MDSKRSSSFIFCMLLTCNTTFANDLTVRINSIANHEGNIRVAMFSLEYSNHFPDGQAMYTGSIAADTSGVKLVFRDVKLGLYAVSAYHDKNNNEELDTGFFGMPQEPVGNSGARTDGKPEFDSSSFIFNGKKQLISFDLH